jgi:hypothetical protein
MIYTWGLVASRKSKKIASHLKYQNQVLFHPSYGKLSTKIVRTNRIPLSLSSATCRPVAVRGVLKSLKLTAKNVWILRGELTQPEVCILFIAMELSLSSYNDLQNLYSPNEQTPNEKIIPLLIYSTTKILTVQAMKVINIARGNKKCKKHAKGCFSQ